ncbi:MAG: ATP-binding cassette domain-containing protein [Candidatus Pacebacteria bacterium]|nr:ATP-binding cassette domain-containing protein [Candidatus Paceibacterota bacterium]
MLKFIRVTKKYNPDKIALDSVTFNVDSGELILITGPSGSGKTTILKLLNKEEEPTDGEIYFKEENINSLRRSRVPLHRRKIGAVFQDYKLLPELNIWENIALALSILGHPDHEIEEKVTDLLKLVDLTDKAYLFPHQLSGGEAQRISIARALSTAPELIFADEPTGNLDEDNSRIVAKLLKKINELGTTVIVTTHDPVVIKTLSGARKMTLENGELTDSKQKEDKKDKLEKSKEEKEDNQEVDEKEKKEKKKENFPKKKQSSKDEVEKKESSLNFFGLFGKKKKEEKTEDKEDKADDDDDKKNEDKKSDDEDIKTDKDEKKKEDKTEKTDSDLAEDKKGIVKVEDLDDDDKASKNTKKVKKDK